MAGFLDKKELLDKFISARRSAGMSSVWMSEDSGCFAGAGSLM